VIRYLSFDFAVEVNFERERGGIKNRAAVTALA